ncbi:MAG: right-handed parallel beta-helix repeat-containing protein [bacterium]|nr:right-handed parallel beta-helix repeat-containing protein [bacterium]
MKKLITLSLFLVFASACGKPYKKEDIAKKEVIAEKEEGIKKEDDIRTEEWKRTGITNIAGNMTWRNDVQVRGIIQVEKGAKLTILPGTKIEFIRIDKNNDGAGEAGMVIYGNVVAEGIEANPIIFTSAASVKNKNDWQGIYLEGSNDSLFRNCIIEYADKALHMHSSPAVISRCELRFNQGALHFRDSNIMLDHNYIHHNIIGLRIWDSDPVITSNTVRENQTGIFCAEGVKNIFIQNNNIYENSEYNVGLGESQKDNVNAQNNYWGSKNYKDIEQKIYDKSDSEYIGKVIYSPFLFEMVDINK